jgi:hypothetical protein
MDCTSGVHAMNVSTLSIFHRLAGRDYRGNMRGEDGANVIFRKAVEKKDTDAKVS